MHDIVHFFLGVVARLVVVRVVHYFNQLVLESDSGALVVGGVAVSAMNALN